jgi:hypothetical protein
LYANVGVVGVWVESAVAVVSTAFCVVGVTVARDEALNPLTFAGTVDLAALTCAGVYGAGVLVGEVAAGVVVGVTTSPVAGSIAVVAAIGAVTAIVL